MCTGKRNQMAAPSLVIFDLNTDQLLHRYFFKASDMKEDSFFANVVSIVLLFSVSLSTLKMNA